MFSICHSVSLSAPTAEVVQYDVCVHSSFFLFLGRRSSRICSYDLVIVLFFWRNLNSVLSFQVWIIFLIAYIFISFALFLVAKLSPFEWRKPHEKADYRVNKFGLHTAFWFTIAGCFRQCKTKFSFYDNTMSRF